MKKTLLISLLLSLAISCGPIKKLSNTITDTKSDTEALLNDAIDQISHESSSWQATLQELANKLTDETQSTIRNEVQNLANRTIAAAGAELRCNVDFLSARVVQGLQRIKANLLGQAPPPRVPAFCSVIPTAVDMNLTPNRRTKIDIVGYDFDNQPLKLFLLSGTQKIDMTSALNRLTHYHMVINLGSNGILLNAASNRLVLEYNNQEFSSIPITQPQIPDCIEEEITFDPSEITFTPRHTRGDKEYDGNGPRVTASARISVEGNEIKARISMKAEETKSDWTTAESTDTYTIYVAPSNRKIVSITSDTFTDQTYIDSNHTADVFEQGSGELIKRFRFMGDTDGDDAGTRTNVKVTFNRVRIKLKQVGNCVN